MTNIKQICAQLIELWDAGCDINTEINELRTALAESESEGPTLDEIDDLCAEHSFCYEDSESLECLLLIIADALARWGK